MTRTCFVICPIGPKESDVRKASDDVYDLIIEPALERFGFEVIRADKLSTVGSITADIIRLVQTADLCVVDITGQNPNVMYECGRRHETGKPYIMIAREGEKLPFDIGWLRTIFYNCADGREIRGTVKTIQAFIDKMLQEGLEPGGSGESLTAISDSLQRIERQINGLYARLERPLTATARQAPNVELLVKKLGPVGAFNYALTKSDPELAEALIPILEKKVDARKFRYSVLAQASRLGSRMANERLDELLDSLVPASQEDMYIAMAYIDGALENSRSERALSLLDGFFREAMTSADLIATDRASVVNHKQKLLYACGRLDEALDCIQQAITLDPQEPAYLNNMSYVLEAKKDLAGAYEAAKEGIDLAESAKRELTSGMLSQAIRVYCRAGHGLEAHRLMQILQQTDPIRAEVLQGEEEVRTGLASA